MYSNDLIVAPLDQKFRDENFFNIGERLPAILAGDLVGTVIKNGPNADFPLGTHVFSQMLLHLPQGGGLQEYTIINGLYTAIVPASISDEEAALYPINAVTTAMALFSTAGLGLPFPGTTESESFDYASQKLVIIGGGSNTGKLAIQFARLAGIGIIITTASLSSAALLRSFGATHVIARQDPDIEEQVRHIVGDELLYVYDTFSSDHSLGISLLSSSQKGTLIHNASGQADEAVLSKKSGVEYRHIRGFSHFIPEFGQMFWKQFPIWLETGEIMPVKYKVIDGLDSVRVNEALDEYREGTGGDRYHVRMVNM
jgi:NADPH2:quinone reductase